MNSVQLFLIKKKMTQIILARNQQNTSNQPNKVTPPQKKKEKEKRIKQEYILVL